MNQNPEAIKDKTDKYFSLKICKYEEKHLKKAKDKRQPKRQYLQHWAHGRFTQPSESFTVTCKAWEPDRQHGQRKTSLERDRATKGQFTGKGAEPPYQN